MEGVDMAALKGGMILAAVDTTGSFYEHFRSSIHECVQIGRVLGRPARGAWIDQRKSAGPERLVGTVGDLAELAAPESGALIGGFFTMVDVLNAARLGHPEPPALLVICLDFMEERPKKASFGPEFLAWASRIERVAVLGVPGAHKLAMEWGGAAEILMGRPVERWEPGMGVAWAEAAELRASLAAGKPKAAGAPNSL